MTLKSKNSWPRGSVASCPETLSHLAPSLDLLKHSQPPVTSSLESERGGLAPSCCCIQHLCPPLRALAVLAHLLRYSHEKAEAVTVQVASFMK